MKRFALLSVFAHVAILIAASLVLDFQSPIENIQKEFITGYIHHEQIIVKHKQSYDKYALHHKTPHKPLTSFKANQISTDKSEKVNDDKLLVLLHTAIAEKQIYPENAIELKQSGTVKISLRLNPDGRITQTQIAKSSGFENLDNAALTAVQAISRLTGVDKYLKQAEVFDVDVVFNLS